MPAESSAGHGDCPAPSEGFGAPDADETLEGLRAARERAAGDLEAGSANPEAVESLGQGWIAEEALAIPVYCALVAPDFEAGALLAVNHGGDSDSTGAITGNLPGTLHGVGAIPAPWLEELEAPRRDRGTR